jgi:hypothetical protein
VGNRQHQRGNIHIFSFFVLLALIGAGIYFVVPFAIGPGCAPPEDTVVILHNDEHGYCLWAISPVGKRTAMGQDNHQYCAPDAGVMQGYADQYNSASLAVQQTCVEQLRSGAIGTAKHFWQKWLQK